MLIETQSKRGPEMFHYTDETGRRKALIETLRSNHLDAPAERNITYRYPSDYVEAYNMDDALVAQLPVQMRKEILDKKQVLQNAVAGWKTLTRMYALRDELLAMPLDAAAEHKTVLRNTTPNMELFTVDYIIDRLADDFKDRSSDGYTHTELYTIHETTNF